jgi:hypothetical protein
MALISDAQKNKDGINILNQIEAFLKYNTAMTGIVNVFIGYKTTYSDPADKAEIDLKLTQASNLVTALKTLIDSNID